MTHAGMAVCVLTQGRLVDFLATHEQEFPALTTLVRQAFATGASESGVAVVNLNLRSVVAPAEGCFSFRWKSGARSRSAMNRPHFSS